MVSVQDVKKVNDALSELRSRNARERAEIEVLKTRIESDMASLSQLIGKPVTWENVNQVVAEYTTLLETQMSAATTYLSSHSA